MKNRTLENVELRQEKAVSLKLNFRDIIHFRVEWTKKDCLYTSPRCQAVPEVNWLANIRIIMQTNDLKKKKVVLFFN